MFLSLFCFRETIVIEKLIQLFHYFTLGKRIHCCNHWLLDCLKYLIIKKISNFMQWLSRTNSKEKPFWWHSFFSQHSTCICCYYFCFFIFVKKRCCRPLKSLFLTVFDAFFIREKSFERLPLKTIAEKIHLFFHSLQKIIIPIDDIHYVFGRMNKFFKRRKSNLTLKNVLLIRLSFFKLAKVFSRIPLHI